MDVVIFIFNDNFRKYVSNNMKSNVYSIIFTYHTIYSLHLHRLDTSCFLRNTKAFKRKKMYTSWTIKKYDGILLTVIWLFTHCPLLAQFSWPYKKENQNLIITAEWAFHLGIALWDPLWNTIKHKLMFMCFDELNLLSLDTFFLS